jgi:hypothetical protein
MLPTLQAADPGVTETIDPVTNQQQFRGGAIPSGDPGGGTRGPSASDLAFGGGGTQGVMQSLDQYQARVDAAQQVIRSGSLTATALDGVRAELAAIMAGLGAMDLPEAQRGRAEDLIRRCTQLLDTISNMSTRPVDTSMAITDGRA